MRRRLARLLIRAAILIALRLDRKCTCLILLNFCEEFERELKHVMQEIEAR
jgi:hypothetical protein